MLKISLDEVTRQQLARLATKHSVAPEALAASYILRGIQNARFWIFSYIGACLLTAFLSVLGIWFLSVSMPLTTVAPNYLHWARVAFLLFVPWPITILLSLWIVARSESAVALLLGLLGFIRKVKLFGTEIELNEQTKRKIQSAANEIDAALREYKERVDKELSRIIARYQVEQKLSSFIDSAQMKAFVPERDDTFRCTVHIPDPIHYGRLYQLLDYYPTGSGHARTFSNRYGIIGKVWRTETAIWADDLFNPQTAHEERADVTSSGAEIPGSEEKIIIAAPGLQILQLIEDVGSSMPTVREKEISAVMKDWGMNRREAETALKHRSYFCCPLVHDNIKVGLLFMDSTRKSAFKADGRNDVLKAADEALAPIIHKIIDDLSGVAIQIEFDA